MKSAEERRSVTVAAQMSHVRRVGSRLRRHRPRHGVISHARQQDEGSTLDGFPDEPGLAGVY